MQLKVQENLQKIESEVVKINAKHSMLETTVDKTAKSRTDTQKEG